MTNQNRVDIEATLDAVFASERALREQSEKLLQAPHGALLGQLRLAYQKACEIKEEQERSLQLVCITRLLLPMPGPGAIDLLIDILGNESEEARNGAGMVIQDIAADRPGEVRKAIERAAKRLPVGSLALSELPYVILGLLEEDPVTMLRPFLSHEDPEAVAAAIEAYLEFADPRAIEFIEPLVADQRFVQLDDDSTGESEQIRIGELAQDAIDGLHEVVKMFSDDEN